MACHIRETEQNEHPHIRNQFISGISNHDKNHPEAATRISTIKVYKMNFLVRANGFKR
jgi:hypothetical protein